MTFEQKVEKLRGIVDKKIAIWCENNIGNEDFVKCVNVIKNKYDKTRKFLDRDTCYMITSLSSTYDWCDIDYFKSQDYQIIPYSEFFADDKVKSLEDWTLGELKEYCDNSDGCPSDCIFQNSCCEAPNKWKLREDKLPLTQSEIELLKSIKVLYPSCDTIFYSHEFEMFTNNDKGYGLVQINTNRLPSLSHDVTYSISELLEGVD